MKTANNLFLTAFETLFVLFGFPILFIFLFRHINNKGPVSLQDLNIFINSFSNITIDDTLLVINDIKFIVNAFTIDLPSQFGQIEWGGWDVLSDVLQVLKIIGQYVSTGFNFLVQLPRLGVYLVKDFFEISYTIVNAFLKLSGVLS